MFHGSVQGHLTKRHRTEKLHKIESNHVLLYNYHLLSFSTVSLLNRGIDYILHFYLAGRDNQLPQKKLNVLRLRRRFIQQVYTTHCH